ncbi:MAG: hypothetical protein FJ087_15780 [Deltaproteobacteria bacterium]|nr:hypothetical protein [Deltaproteobacteria bacterium]
MKKTLAGSFAILMACAGCDAGGMVAIPPDAADAPDAATVADLPADTPAEVAPEAAAPDTTLETVVPDPYVPPKSVRVEGGGRDGDLVVVRVVARDFEPLFGVALRVEWDPAAFSLGSVTTEPIFGQEGVYKAAEVRPGSLAIGMAQQGHWLQSPVEGDAALATIRLRPISGKPSAVSFFPARCLFAGERLAKVEGVTYLGATVNP